MIIQPPNTRRLFLGFSFNEAFHAPFQEIRNRLYQREITNITKVENLHITLAFIGNVENQKVDEVTNLVKGFPFNTYQPKFTFEEFRVKVNNKKVMLWATFNPNEDAINLHTQLHDILDLKPDHKFRPHITFCRARKDKTALNKNQFNDIKLNDYTAVKTVLFESSITKKGVLYTPLLSMVNLT